MLFRIIMKILAFFILLVSTNSFANEYRTNCRLEFTQRCLKDLGNATIYGEVLGKGKRVAIKPRI